MTECLTLAGGFHLVSEKGGYPGCAAGLSHPPAAFNASSCKSVSVCAAQSGTGAAPTSRCTGQAGIWSYYLWARGFFSPNLMHGILFLSTPDPPLPSTFPKIVLFLSQNASSWIFWFVCGQEESFWPSSPLLLQEKMGKLGSNLPLQSENDFPLQFKSYLLLPLPNESLEKKAFVLLSKVSKLHF